MNQPDRINSEKFVRLLDTGQLMGDPDYQFVVVSEPNREFLWILSRTPALGDATLSGIKTRLTARGFDIAKLQFKPHSAKTAAPN